MKTRVFFLLLTMILRIALGFVESLKYRQEARVRVTGNIDKIYQNDSKCVIKTGRFWINFREKCSFSRTDRISVIGRVEGGVIDRFLGRLWLTSVEISVLRNEDSATSKTAIEGSILRVFREKIIDRYRRYLSMPESGLVAGIVLGDKNDMGRSFYQQMVKSGTIHIAVASGYNVMLVGGVILSWCFWICKRKWATVVAIVVMAFYAALAGGEPPVMRAVLMSGLVYMAAAVGRRVVSWWVLLVAAWAMLIIDPSLLLDVGFQLSVVASVGLVVIEPWLGRILEKWDGGLKEILSGSGLLTTVSTLLLTLPVIWFHFGRMSLIGILSNTLILPLVPLLMILGVLMLVLPGVFYVPVYAVAHWMVLVIGYFGS